MMYIENLNKVIGPCKKFQHVMAITLDPLSKFKKGIVRCITSRQGDVQVAGYIDRSVLYAVKGDSLKKFSISKKLAIRNESEIIGDLGKKDWDFIGLEDPDIWIDEQTKLTHLYFTIAFTCLPAKQVKNDGEFSVSLGHAIGKDLDSLEMTEPILIGNKKNGSAKEVSIAPLNKQKFRYNLVESSETDDNWCYSVIKTAIAEDMGKPWRFGKTIFHPARHRIPWIAGHASPGPLFPQSFIDVGQGKRLGALNGRAANQNVKDEIKYGMFSVGLFIYDFEKGEIDWVSPQPFIQDSQAKTITFASQFIETKKGQGILYAHVDDSFVRAYDISEVSIKSFLAKNS